MSFNAEFFARQLKVKRAMVPSDTPDASASSFWFQPLSARLTLS